jgi:hypothetical protein
MADKEKIKQLVQEAVGEALRAKTEELCAEIESAVIKAISPELNAGSSAEVKPNEITGGLNSAVASIRDGSSQADILKALLEGCAKFAPRAVLFILKQGNLVPWQFRGVQNEAALKGFSISSSAGLAGRAIQDKMPVSAAAAEFDSGFISTHGNPNGGNALVLPLLVRDKVAAVMYADSGTAPGGTADQSALELLVSCASLWLEVTALRKAGVSGEMEAPQAMAAAASAAPAPAAAPEPAPLAASPAPATAVGEPSLDGLSKEDQELHKKAKRFAKLLVDEIKLYNKDKVAEGKAGKDVYARLQEDIEKSRATYDKRYSATSAGSAGYFDQELIRILADGDVSVMGSGFPH